MSARLEEDVLRIGALEVRPQERSVFVDGQEVQLTAGEYSIVFKLAEHPGWVCSPEQLAHGVGAVESSPESVSVLVSRLRQRLAAAGLPDVIETARGFGYRLQSGSANSEDDRPVDGSLHDSAWRVMEAAIDAAHAGTPEQQLAAVEALERARRDIYAALADRQRLAGAEHTGRHE